MKRQVLVDRDEQEAMKGRVREAIAGGETYDDIRQRLEGLGFRAKEDNPALALWENPEHELFVMIHMDAGAGKVRDYDVRTFEETEGYE